MPVDRVWLWIGFNAFILVMLAVDLFVAHRETHAVSIKEASIWTGVWVGLALLFGLGVYHFGGAHMALEYYTGYVIEKSLSVDNIFVFVLIFSYFGVPDEYQHRVLIWGVLGALVMRGTMIAAGAFLLQHFDWVIYVFGAFLVVTAWRMATQNVTSVKPKDNPVIRLLRSHLPVTKEFHGQKFFVSAQEAGEKGTSSTWLVTPLFVALVMVETTDLIFALDSIPAIFGVTRDAFLVYSSNVFAILGLRSLYFLLAGVVDRLVYLETGLAIVLGFMGVKMLVEDVYEIPVSVSLGVIAAVLTVTIVASLTADAGEDDDGGGSDDHEPEAGRPDGAEKPRARAGAARPGGHD